MPKQKINQETLPPGLYYIGDPTYLSLAEGEIKKIFDGTGVFTNEKGRKCVVFSITGDGVYLDNDGHSYGVDSCRISAYPIESLEEAHSLGRGLEFLEQVRADYDEETGVISFGDVHIHTDPFDKFYADVPETKPDGMSDLDWLRLRAEAEDIDAQYELYEKLKDDPETHRESFKWVFSAARGGNALAQYDAGYLRKYGEDHQNNYREAVRWFRQSAEQGHAIAQFELGESLANGSGVELNYEEAAKWYLAAAEQGWAWAQHNLGGLYVYGDGVEQSDGKALEWYEQAAAQNYPFACVELARAYLGFENSPRVERDLKKGFELLVRGVEEFFDVFFWEEDRETFISAATEFLENRRDEKHLHQARKLADGAEPNELIAFCYEYGIGVEKDVKRARYWRELEVEDQEALD